MNGRERLTALCRRQPVDRIAWTTLVDDRSRIGMPPEVRKMPVLDFYRHIGCDVLQFGNMSLPKELHVNHGFRRVAPKPELETIEGPDGMVRELQRYPWGTLTLTRKNGRILEHPVRTIEDVRLLTRVWEESYCEETAGEDAGCCCVNRAIGESGIYVPVVPESVLQSLLQFYIGMENFYYLLRDYPAELERLFGAMHASRKTEYEIVARRLPFEAVISLENTSSTLISPSVYRRYCLPHLQDFCETMHRHGRKAILHMCGLLKNLLPVIRETGLDGVNALTPPPVGDTPYEHALDVLGEDTITLGGIFPPDILHKPGVTRQEIWNTLDRMFTPRLRASHFLLWIAVDGLPTDLEKFLMIREWIEKNGSL